MSASALPLELLLEIFQRVYKDDFGRALHVPDARGSAVPQVALRLYARADLHSCLFVCRSWYYAAVKVLWEDPDFVRVASFDRLLRYLDQPRCRCRRRRRRRRPSGPGLGPAARPDDDLDDTAAARTAVGRIGLVQVPFVRRVHIVSSPVLLDNSTWLATYLTDAHLDVLRANLGLLTSLSLKDCRGITDSAVCALVAKVGRRLKSLDLSGCRTLGDVTVQVRGDFLDYSVSWKKKKKKKITPGRRPPNLASLPGPLTFPAGRPARSRPSRFSFPLSNFLSLSPSLLLTLFHFPGQAVAEFCGKSLEHLSLRCCGLVSDVGAAYIASVCGANGTLKSLDLSWCRRVSDAAVVNLVNQCAAYRGPLKRMRHPPSGPPAPPPSGAPAPPRPPSPPPPPPRARRGPDESRAPAAHARDVTAGRDLRNLRSLSVVGCRGITRAGILSILRMLLSEPASENAAAAPPAGGLLEELEFSCPVPTSSRVPYMFSSLEHALALFRNLRKLTIHNAMYMSSQMLSTLVSNLGQDDESDFDDGTGAGARRAAAPALRSLNLVQCKALNDKHMMVLLSRCSRLEELRIPGARGVSDSTLQELSAAGCADHLRVLNLDDCVNLSDHGLAALASARKAPGSGASGKRSRKPPRAWYRTEEWRPAASGLRPPPPPPQAGFAAASDWWGFPNLEELR
ncbi:MAG: hypothetical protein BJ554DRAFT_3354 [Olpidium bornovanus]|uniref:F-box domain-containing protein n=1 Tax=Olpidium bornovanus TaxID=278681 RepID=A0A8H8DLL2_9FUNG|nr:MAG: hypothetical protein BJ554DRAFT_3354 [Olpidium bornovanus]